MTKTKADAGMRPDASNKNTANPSISRTTDNRRWMQFDEWLEAYERSTGADSWHPSIPGGPRGWR